MAEGVVKWFNAEKGYGFIAPDDGNQAVFVDYTEIDGEGFRTLEEDQRVRYELEQGDRGLQATHVRAL